MKILSLLLASAVPALAALPSVGPDYTRPATATPAAYRFADGAAVWKAAVPADTASRDGWWTLFGDPNLDGLESVALSGNQDLQAAAARVQQAVAAAGLARSAFSPQVAFAPDFERSRFSTTIANPYVATVQNDFNVPLVASWELDLFGRVRRLNEAARADADASAAAFQSLRLSLTANLAATYFSLRGTDRELEILRHTEDLRRQNLKLVSAQYSNGAATQLDTARAEAELANVQTESAALAVHRESLQNGLAVLVGTSALTFNVAADGKLPALPVVPAGLPSELLERRPDIAAAERTLAAANARIGVAKSAFFPAISLTGSAGFEAADTSKLFGADSRIWAFGPSLYLPVFQGGRNVSNLDRAHAVFNESLAAYRQQVLAAFQQVQDALAAGQLMGVQAEAQDRAVSASHRAADLAQKRYDAGYVSFLDVVEAERTELDDQRAAVQLETDRLNVSVALVKALGGTWVPGSAR